MGKVFHIIIGQLRGILVWFDSIVYGLIPTLYKLMLYLANIDLVSDNVPIQGLIRRIYILIGVFMLFKLSFSVLSYIIDPDAFSDQTKGFSNLVKRVIIAVVLLVSIPWIFQEAYVIQGKILTSGILPGIVLGEPSHYSDADGKDDLEKTVETSAKDVQFLLFGPFYSIDYNNEDFKEACTPDAENPSKHILGTIGMASSEECLNAVADSMDNDDTVVASGINIRDFFRNTEDGGEDLRNFSSFGGLASWSTTDGEFAINYMPVISTLCGGYLVFLLLSFCIDVAARIIRLLFLQILSPVAVISSIDPTTSGDRLKEWAKECFKTWASLFLRLLVVFLIIQLVRVITNTVYSGAAEIAVEGYSNKNGINAWIYIFLILGIFSAAKKVPELIEKATGIKMSGELQLNPFKALNENKGLGLAAGVGIGTVGLATGAGAGRILSGVYQGLAGKSVLDVQKSMVEGNRTMRNARSDGSTFGGRVAARATNFFGNQGALGKIEDEKVREENEIHTLEEQKLGLQNNKETIENNIRGVRDEISQRQAVQSAISKIKDRAYSRAILSGEYRNSMARVESLRSRAENSTNEKEKFDLLRVARELESDTERWAHNEGSQEWLNSAAGRNDAVAYSAFQEYRTASEQAHLNSFDYNEGAELWAQEDDITRGVANATSLIADQERNIRDIDEQIRTVDQNIQTHQNRISEIDRDHRRIESNYKAVGGQSGGTREKNATARSDAGQHFGSTNFFGPMGPPPGGPGHRP